MADSWTGVGDVYPSSATMRTRSADRPSESKVKRVAPVWSRRGTRWERDGGPAPRVDGRGRTVGRREHSGKGRDQGPADTELPSLAYSRRSQASTIDRANRRTPPPSAGILSQRQVPNLASWDRHLGPFPASARRRAQSDDDPGSSCPLPAAAQPTVIACSPRGVP